MSAPWRGKLSLYFRHQPLCGEDRVAGATDLGNKIYSTNVPGIGMRFSRGGATVNIVYPDVFSSRVYNTTNYSLEGSRFTLEIIKTAATTGSGTGGG